MTGGGGANGRKDRILALLRTAAGPVPGEDLGERFGVGRTAICHDIALLRAEGHRILSTPRGYLLEAGQQTGYRDVVTVRHGLEDAEAELNALVDAGVTVADVIVEHPVYGEIRGDLQIRGRDEVTQFMARLRADGAPLLSSLTGGVHVHTLWAADPARLDRARQKLAALGMLLEPEAARGTR